jgi:hypothetical protein
MRPGKLESSTPDQTIEKSQVSLTGINENIPGNHHYEEHSLAAKEVKPLCIS